jgi:dihydropteroate synthase
MDRPRAWRLAEGREITLDAPRVMGILNVTPDSFSDGGQHASVPLALAAARCMAAAGADVIDVGGESTRPGAQPVGAHEQMRRIVPVIRAIRGDMGDGVAISVDTTLSEVAAAAIDAGASAINDVSAGLDDEDMLRLAAEAGVGLVLMHRRLAPRSDAYSTEYPSEPGFDGGVVECVRRFLAERSAAAMEAGVAREAIVVDPGLGFGKSVAQNLELIARTAELATLRFPVMSGVSRKSFAASAAGMTRESPPRERVHATLGLSLAHRAAGAAIFRVHDVEAHVRALRAFDAGRTPGPGIQTNNPQRGA